MPEAASAASMADDGDDDLDRLLSSLGRQREQMAARRKELDDREQALADREADLERRDQELSDRALSLDDRETDLTQREGALGEQANAAATAQLDADWQEKLQSFEDTNRQYAQAAAALADWAVELRNASGGEESSSGAAEAESEPLKSSSSAGRRLPRRLLGRSGQPLDEAALVGAEQRRLPGPCVLPCTLRTRCPRDHDVDALVGERPLEQRLRPTSRPRTGAAARARAPAAPG